MLTFAAGIVLIAAFIWKKYSINIQSNLFGVVSLQKHREKTNGRSSPNEVNSTTDIALSTKKPNNPPPQINSLPESERTSSADELNVSNLKLPEFLTDKALMRRVSKARAREIWLAQDKIISAWPAYSDTREQLQKELQKELDPNNASEQEFLDAALNFRQKFWQTGGESSSESYTYAYKSRLLLELAHNKYPENLTITDELVETIQATYPATMFDPKTGKRTRNEEMTKNLLELRSSQFKQIKREIDLDGRTPAWQDFVRAADLVVLSSIYDKDSALAIVDWLKTESGRGGWSAYNEALDDVRQIINRGSRVNFNIYAATKQTRDETFRYGRRFPSFRGPDPEKRGVIPWSQGLNTTDAYSSGISKVITSGTE